MTWTIRQCIDAKRIKLAGHLLRADDSDPMRQVSFQNNSGPGRPPQKLDAVCVCMYIYVCVCMYL